MTHIFITLIFLVHSSLTFAQFDARVISSAQYVGCGANALTGQFGLAPIFEQTFESNSMWQFQNDSFLVPDQMIVTDLMIDRLSVLQQVASTFDEYFESFKSWYQFSVSFQAEFDLAFQYDQQLDFVYRYLHQESTFLLHGSHFWSLCHVELYPPYMLNLNPMFVKAINDLPQSIVNQNDYQMYQEFIDTFGTHLLGDAVSGAKIDYNNIVFQNLTKSFSLEWISDQYSLSFYTNMFGIDDGGFSSKSQINVSVAYQESRLQNLTFYGGDPFLTNDLIKWLDSVPFYLYPLNGTLIPLWELFPNQSINAQKIQTFQSFVNNYDTLSNGRYTNPPGLSCIGAGFNVASFQGCGAPLFDWTYNLNQTYPDQIFVTPTPDSIMMQDNITMTSVFDLTTWQSTFYSSSYGFLGMGTSTSEAYDFYSMYFKQERSLSQMWLYITYSTITLPLIETPKLNPLFQSAIDLLPIEYNDTTSIKYQEFFQTFGMAFPDVITLGGSLSLNVWYDLFFLKQNGVQWVQQNSDFSFMGVLGDGEGHSTFSNKIDSYFLQTIIVDFQYVGGNILSTTQPNDYKQWMSTILSNMQPITYHLQPITMLIQNVRIRNNLNQAIQQYLNQSVRDLNNYINDYQSN